LSQVTSYNIFSFIGYIKYRTQINSSPATVPLYPRANHTSVNVNINVASNDGDSNAQQIELRVCRVACSCPNCTNGDRHSKKKKRYLSCFWL
jgi:hypothetical protein